MPILAVTIMTIALYSLQLYLPYLLLPYHAHQASMEWIIKPKAAQWPARVDTCTQWSSAHLVVKVEEPCHHMACHHIACHHMRVPYLAVRAEAQGSRAGGP